MNKHFKILHAATVATLLANHLLGARASANIYQWQYINPADQSLGKKQSTTLCISGAGVTAAPGANLSSRDLTKAYLIGADLSSAFGSASAFDNADLSQANLTGARFGPVDEYTGAARLRGANFGGANLTGTDFSGFQGVTFDGYITFFIGADLTGANFAAANLTSTRLFTANLSNANLSQATLNPDFRGVTLTGANLTGTVVAGRRFDVVQEVYQGSFGGITPAQLYTTASYQAHNLTGIGLLGNSLAGVNLSGQNLTNADLTGATLTIADFAGAQIRGASFMSSNIAPAQLYSTANYQAHDLAGIGLGSTNMTGANFAGQNLTGANFSSATLSGANFAGANVHAANFRCIFPFSGTGITAAQLSSTTTYQAHDLGGMDLTFNNLTGANFAGYDLTHVVLVGAALAGADLRQANLSGVRFTGPFDYFGYAAGCDLGGANLSQANLTNADLSGSYYTDGPESGGYVLATLTGANLSQANLTNARLSWAVLGGANFTGAEVRGADFTRERLWAPYSDYQYAGGLTPAQLQSTASYQVHDLTGINLTGNVLTNANFVGQNLANANLYGVDARGALGLSPAASTITTNLIRANGHVAGLDLRGDNVLTVGNYHGAGAPKIVVDQYLAMEVNGSLRLLFDTAQWDSTIAFAPGIPVTLGDATLAGHLEPDFAAGVDVGGQLGRTFHVFDWAGVTRSGAFNVSGVSGAWDQSQLYTRGDLTFGYGPQWNVNAGGNWTTLGNWAGGFPPNDISAVARFGSAITAPRTVTVDAPRIVAAISFDNASRYTLAGTGTITIAPEGTGNINVFSGSHTIAAPLLLAVDTHVNVAQAGSVLTISGDTTASAGVGITKTGLGVLEMKAIRAQSLAVDAGAVRILANGTSTGTSTVKAVSIAGSIDAWTGKLDLTNNAMVLDYVAGASPLATIQNQLKSGFNGGAWTGNGISSSSAAATSGSAHKLALGIAEATDFNSSFPGTFRGQPIDSSSVLVRYTASGDANLDGTVDLTDFTLLAANFNGGGKRWALGDFNYSGNVDLTDFSYLASNFNVTVTAAGDAIGSAVPEPAVAWLAPLAATALVSSSRPRRRRLVI